jgi:hypothetical protein
VLTERPGPAKASAAFVDTVPSTLPPQGVRILPVNNILLMPASVDPATLPIATPQAAIAAAPPLATAGTAQAVLANVTVGSEPRFNNSLLWVVTQQLDQPVQGLDLGGMPVRADQNWVVGSLYFIDPQTGAVVDGHVLYKETPERQALENEILNGQTPQPQSTSPEPQPSPS